MLFEIPKGSANTVIEKAKTLFGTRVEVADFPQKSDEIEKGHLAGVHSKQALKVNKQSHPVPEVKPDKATLVVVCPPLAARYSGRGNQYKLHDRVVAVNKSGTYSYAYVDPGKYLLASQSENANGFEMELEAGKEYFFLQNTFQGAFKGRTVLSRNSRELVLYELSGAHYADWTPKEAGKYSSPKTAH